MQYHSVPIRPRIGAFRQQEPVVLGKLIATYLAGIDEAVLLSAEFEKEAAFDLLTQIETRHLNKIQAAMQSLMQHTIEDIAASREDLVTAANRNLQRNLAIGFLGGAMFLGVAFYVSRRASVRITDLLNWSQKIAAGDLSDRPVSHSGDEAGQLTNAMRDMVQNLARGRGELEQARVDAEADAEVRDRTRR